MPVLDITSQTRSALRAAAHPLKPVVLLGDKGLSASVLQEIDRNLSAHGLIKVRAGGEDRAAREEILHQICDQLACAPVHHLGKILILYRPTESDPEGKAFLDKKAGFDVSTLGLNTHRKASEPHVPKRQAQAGKPAPERKRTEKVERTTGPITARERYLGATEKKTRPSLHDEAGSARGAARKSAPRRTDGGLTSTLGAARKKATSFTKPGSARSALSLRAGARSGAPRKTRGDR
ncbi:hypothetical protein GCM10007242_47800 [Pigmentiphaga litoralis]|jgi:RNA-binding protein|uniref:YhbY family RNA-binding protein n=1 Tax=Pigmentiphaga litoralis TaxID=516702 RepID=UPI0016797D6A|nr:YhbY family RNA-binding protein [Pigmentiphaga litoralis]GGX35216.1 hypothetical protein GCM10007242_47800 [Pigmentiphaga litoralis]